ncbi:hypothetical protein OCS_06916 [Ophiocordyceps sinensis CO18]|uniref:Uncharacterized protein n=1 Tax=Ophiocordyceps sinensis (strain Co18 / CGMCC 3.14243) TaxID=911162 RepID=T5A6C7_OPHSC|nr:hypothetical protein OCS_06916 [Ophiocordyceps sinensis CO18]
MLFNPAVAAAMMLAAQGALAKPFLGQFFVTPTNTLAATATATTATATTAPAATATAGTACSRPGQIMEACDAQSDDGDEQSDDSDHYTNCLCNTHDLFQAALECKKQTPGADAEYIEAWRDFYARLRMGFCRA